VKHSSLQKQFYHRHTKEIVRHQCSLRNINLFVSFDSSSPSSDQQQRENGEADFIYRRFLPISSNNSVYSQYSESLSDSGGVETSTSFSNQKWHKLTISSFHSLLLCDVVENKLRFLISDLPNSLSPSFPSPFPSSFNSSTIHLQISISQYFLLLSLYFDNFFEEPQFSHQHAGESSRTHGVLPNDLTGNETTNERPLSPYPPYGTTEYMDYIRNNSFDFEIHLVRSEIIIDFMMNSCSHTDTTMSAPTIPSLTFLTFDPQSCSLEDEERDVVPFASLQIKWLSFHSFHGEIATQIAFGIGDLLLTDTRSLDRSHGVHTLRLSQSASDGILHHGYANFNYGTLQPTCSLLSAETTDLPLQGVQELLCPYRALDKGIHPYNSLDNPTPCPDNSSALRYAIQLRYFIADNPTRESTQ
jgi:hypothetical protein